MSLFDPDALNSGPAKALQDFAGSNDDAPAVLMEIARGGLSVRNAAGTTERYGDEAASTDNTFEVGSQTKMMTSVIVQQLVGEGAIDFDAPLAEQMDLTGLEDIPNIGEVTVRELLANRSGIPDFDTIPGQDGLPAFIEQLLDNPTQPFGPDDMLGLVAEQPADFAPGEAYGYSNTNYLLLQKLIEQKTGDSFAELMSDRIFSVAGMDDSSMKSEGQTDGLLRSYAELSPSDIRDVTDVPIDFGAAGGVVSTTSDIIRFMDALLVSRTLLPPDQLEEMLDFRAPDGTPSLNGESLGLVSAVLFGQQFIGFSGGTLGTNTATYLHVESGTIFSIATTFSQVEPGYLLLEAFSAIYTDDNWANFDPSDESFTIAGTAAEISLTEEEDAPGGPETVLELGNASLTFEGRLGDLDTGRFTFSDGSTLSIGTDGRDVIDVLRQTPDSANSDNQLIGGNGNDHLRGGHGNDKIDGGEGRDFIRGRDGDDSISGGEGNDFLRGDRGDDNIDGGDGRDHVLGGQGDDTLSGGDGDDMIRGGEGNDILNGGAGHDLMWGGDGADTFVFQVNAGQDRIFGFDAGEDRLDFSETGLSFEDLEIETFGSYTRISYGDSELSVFGNSCEPLTEDSFIF
ncbi:serine hydrolase [Tateyamaria omphalii]|uniref:serine hydrolase n=1 Tax=Tateyamaria omphalii TaxID=299262 RepID=UPI001C997BE4|nr:serine hydrolase [Tateyamaria omphalii]MBY5931975.1 serine hydrolase [Tateyamaria omphalii]